AGEGSHRLSVTLSIPGAEIEQAQCTITGPMLDESDEHDPVLEVAAMLAMTADEVNGGMAMLILHRTNPNGTVTAMSWAVTDLAALPASAELSRSAHWMGWGNEPLIADPTLSFADAPALV
ncbi:hypothetical protein, partial [Streptomyces sp. NPDC058728]